MSGNLGGFRSSRRYAPLLTFPRDVMPGLITPCDDGDDDDKVAAGMNPAAHTTLV
jgi:hypothetical protein